MLKRILLLLIFCTSSLAEARLGAAVEVNDGKTVIQRPLYSIYEMKSYSGQVREYVSKADGKIFGIAWTGLNHPDLEPLLGNTYFAHYQKISAAKPRQHHRHHHVKSKKLEVRLEGHMRAFRGAVHDPSLLPAGVKIDEII